MGYRSCQLNVSHTLTAHTGFCYFYAASVADYAFVANFLIFTAMALPVFAWSEDSFTEQTVFFRFQRSVVDGLRFFYLAMGPLPDFLRGGKSYFDGIKAHLVIFFFCCFWHLITPFLAKRRSTSYMSSSELSSRSR